MVVLGILASIIAVTAVLINAEPPDGNGDGSHGRGNGQPEMDDAMAEGHEPFEGTVQLGDMQAMVTVDPAMPGENTITIMFMETAEKPSK